MAGGAAIILGGGVIVPVSLVVGVGAGTYQIVASAKGWTLDDAMYPVQQTLSELQKSEIVTVLQNIQNQSPFVSAMESFLGTQPVLAPETIWQNQTCFEPATPLQASVNQAVESALAECKAAGMPAAEAQALIHGLVSDQLKVVLPVTSAIDDALLSDLQTLFAQAKQATSPIILDLDGDGVETMALVQGAYDGVNFDLDAQGLAEQTGWVGSDDGLLVRDIDGDGEIASGRELFGNHTMLSNGQVAENGFQALADLDGNGDGLIDANDSAWGTLKVWRDLNSDGTSDDGELLDMATAGVLSIAVAHTQSTFADASGNEHRQIGSYTSTYGVSRDMADVWFAVDTARTVATDNVPVPEAVAALPDISGMGDLRSLQQTMARDASGDLQALVQQWIAGSQSQRSAIIDELIFTWAGVQDVDPDSRVNDLSGNVMGDARKLETLEAVLGAEFVGVWCWGELDENPHEKATPLLNEAYNRLQDHVSRQLYWQTDAKPVLDALELQWVDNEGGLGHFAWDASAALALLGDAQGNDPANDLISAIYFSQGLLERGATQVLNSLHEAAQSQNTNLVLVSIFSAFASLGQTGSQNGVDVRVGSDAGEHLYGAGLGPVVFLGEGGDDMLSGSQMADGLFGGSGNDSLSGMDGNDILAGGYGDDVLDGGTGTDTYHFMLGDGVDTIVENQWDGGTQDTLILGDGLTEAATEVSRVGNDLVITWAGNTQDKIILQSHFELPVTTVERIVFASGAEWGLGDVASRLVQRGTDAGEYIFGTSNQVNRIFAMGGDDYVAGGSENDFLDGGEGNDTLQGDEGDDVLTGGAGDDHLAGGGGSDLYVFNLGDGNDTIQDWDWAQTGGDKIKLGEGLGQSGIAVERVGQNLSIGWAGNETDTLTIQDFFYGPASVVNRIEFADGSTWGLPEIIGNLRQNGTAGSDYIQGLSAIENRINGWGGDDQIMGGNANDRLSGGEGKDLLFGGNGADVFVFDVAPGVENADTVLDFNSLEGDKIALDSAIFSALAGQITVENNFRFFHETPVGEDDFLVYNAETGQLFYDASGNGTSDALLIVGINNPTSLLTHQDFHIF